MFPEWLLVGVQVVLDVLAGRLVEQPHICVEGSLLLCVHASLQVLSGLAPNEDLTVGFDVVGRFQIYIHHRSMQRRRLDEAHQQLSEQFLHVPLDYVNPGVVTLQMHVDFVKNLKRDHVTNHEQLCSAILRTEKENNTGGRITFVQLAPPKRHHQTLFI